MRRTPHRGSVLAASLLLGVALVGAVGCSKSDSVGDPEMEKQQQSMNAAAQRAGGGVSER